jgi:hypothetical protein
MLPAWEPNSNTRTTFYPFSIGIRTQWRWAKPLDTMMIVMILVAGLGVIERSQRFAHA